MVSKGCLLVRAGTGTVTAAAQTWSLLQLHLGLWMIYLILGVTKGRGNKQGKRFGLDLPAPEPCVNLTEGRAGCRQAGRGR